MKHRKTCKSGYVYVDLKCPKCWENEMKITKRQCARVRTKFHAKQKLSRRARPPAEQFED